MGKPLSKSSVRAVESQGHGGLEQTRVPSRARHCAEPSAKAEPRQSVERRKLEDAKRGEGSRRLNIGCTLEPIGLSRLPHFLEIELVPPGGVQFVAFRAILVPTTWSLDSTARDTEAYIALLRPTRNYHYAEAYRQSHVFGCCKPTAETRSLVPSLQQMSISEGAL